MIPLKLPDPGHALRAVRSWIILAAALIFPNAAFAQPVLITTPTTVGPADTFITPSDGGPAIPLATARITVRGTTLTISGRHQIADLVLENQARLNHAPAIITQTETGPPHGLELTVTDNVSIAAQCAIDLTGLGFPHGQGPGRGQDAPDPYRGGGGGYGGAGARPIPNPLVPASLINSGPAYGSFREPRDFGSPGGSSLGGTILGGAGGGCLRLIVGGELNLQGEVRCNGAVSQSGASGSGGSVWISATTLSGTGHIIANGGLGNVSGGAGRIAIQTISLLFDRGSFEAMASSLGDTGTIYIEEGNNPPLLIYKGNGGGSSFNRIPRPLLIDLPNGRVELDGANLVGSTVTIRCADLSITADAAIDTTGMGFPANEGPGRGMTGMIFNGQYVGGAGHGGFGSSHNSWIIAGGQTYGSFSQPTEAGSGGGARPGEAGSAGGGVIRLIVSHLLKLDGELRSNGANTSASTSGSGGSIWITADDLQGTGLISANGVSHAGGGRIAIEANAFDMSMSRLVATGHAAGAGSIFLAVSGQRPRLIYDNRGSDPPIPAASRMPFNIDFPGGDIEFRRCTIVATAFDIRAENLLLDPDARLVTSGFGFPNGEGPGHGLQGPAGSLGGGGGHGGVGASSVGFEHLRGQPYGSAVRPTTPGSGGARSNRAEGTECGGGTVHFTIDDTFTHFGFILSEGRRGGAAAGASGGSIWITANTVEGPGIISTNGFDAGTSSGGGGRVAIYSCTNKLMLTNMTATGPNNATDGSIIIAPIAVEIDSVTSPCYRGSATISAIVAGVGPLSYQWQRNGQPLSDGPQASGASISGTNTELLVIDQFSTAEIGLYQLVATGNCGTATSLPTSLSTCPADTNCDGDTDSDDVDTFFIDWETAEPTADLDGDNDTDSDDILIFFAAWEAGC